jgi:hypothetical protein
MTVPTILLLWTLLSFPAALILAPWLKRGFAGQSVDDVGCEPADRLASPRSISLHDQPISAGRRYNHVA